MDEVVPCANDSAGFGPPLGATELKPPPSGALEDDEEVEKE